MLDLKMIYSGISWVSVFLACLCKRMTPGQKGWVTYSRSQGVSGRNRNEICTSGLLALSPLIPGN